MRKNKVLHTPQYTLCFCISGDKVLMLKRFSEPNKSMWNGLGGKIEKNESIRDAAIREVKEESNLDLTRNCQIIFSGKLSWEDHNKTCPYIYLFLARLASTPEELCIYSETREGILEWKKIDWVCDKNNTSVVSNIPYFLPRMLIENIPLEFHYTYSATDGDVIIAERCRVL